MVIFAGYDGSSRYNDIHLYSLGIFNNILIILDTNQISKLMSSGDVPLTRFGHAAVVFEDSMYVFGGWNGHDTLDELYQYSFCNI
jgi:hypothetical protein